MSLQSNVEGNNRFDVPEFIEQWYNLDLSPWGYDDSVFCGHVQVNEREAEAARKLREYQADKEERELLESTL